MIRNDIIFILLMVEWWLGSQKWLNAKSIVALVISLAGVLYYVIKVSLKKKSS